MKIISMMRVTCTIRWAGPSPLLPRTTELFNSLFYNTCSAGRIITDIITKRVDSDEKSQKYSSFFFPLRVESSTEM